MAAKIALVFVIAFVSFQLLTWGTHATIIRREVPATPAPAVNSSQAIDDAIQSFKTGLDDLLKNIQSNELFQNVSHSLKQFGQQIQQQGQQLVDKIQTSSKSK